MALKGQGRLLKTFIAVAMVLGLGPAAAWGQSEDLWWAKLEGSWCDAEQGCAHWWTHYVVEFRGRVISIRHRDRRFHLFHGEIKEPTGRWTIKAKTTDGKDFVATVTELEGLKEFVQGKIKGALTAKIQAATIEGIRAQEIKGVTISEARIEDPRIEAPKVDNVDVREPKMKEATAEKIGADNSKMEGVRIEDVTIEKTRIKDPDPDGATIKGAKEITGDTLSARKLKAEKLNAEKLNAEKLEAKELQGKTLSGKTIVGEKIEGGKQVEISIPIQISDATIEGIAKPKGEGAKDGDGDGDGQGKKKKMVLKGQIKGKIASSTGPGELKGDFEGEFSAVLQVVIKGVYRVPPPPCSEDGRPLSKEEQGELDDRRERRKGARLATQDKSPDVYALARDLQGYTQRWPGRSRWKAEEKARGEENRDRQQPSIPGTISANAEKAKVPRPTGPNTLGKFMREVSGTLTGIEPFTITLELPPLPVLDHKCSVIDELPKQTLKLVKQHKH